MWAKFVLWFIAVFCLTLVGLAGASGHASTACKACPGNVRISLRQFCDLPFLSFLLPKPNCLAMGTKNNDDMLKKKVCGPLGICGGQPILCQKCNGVYKSVLNTVCGDIDGYFINWGIFKQTFADMCRLIVHIIPADFFNFACKKVGCVKTLPPPPLKKPPPPPPTPAKPKCPATWGYSKLNGPSTWSTCNKICGSGKRQSPVDIVLFKGYYPRFMSNAFLYEWQGFDSRKRTIAGKLSNNGYTVKFTPNSGDKVIIWKSDGKPGLVPVKDRKEYDFLHAEFRWGKSNNGGSEHAFNGRKGPLELQLVFKKKGLSEASALKASDGLKIFALVFRVEKFAYPYQGSGLFRNELTKLSKSPDQMNAEEDATMDIHHFFNLIMKQHVAYSGSLTTPGCNENVEWMVGITDYQASILQADLDAFRSLTDSQGAKMVDNFRPVQRQIKGPCPAQWGYHNNGANLWACKYPTCAGSNQSPVNIILGKNPKSGSQYPYEAASMSKSPISGKVYNNGKTFIFTPLDERQTTVWKRDEPSIRYHLLRIEFRWGTGSSRSKNKGSEHQIGGKGYELEMQMLFIRSDLTEESALKASNGLRAFALLFKVDNSFRPKYTGDGLFKQQIDNIRWFSAKSQIGYKQNANFDIYLYWEKIMKSHVTYAGSLTTPGCNENVEWMVGTTVQLLDMMTFTYYRIYLKTTEPYETNIRDYYRPVQRTVTADEYTVT